MQVDDLGAELPPEDKTRVVAESRYWLRLLHFKSGKSEVDGPEFFFSPKGKKDAHAELRATIEAFWRPLDTKIGRLKQHPQCAFPERLRYLKETLGIRPPAMSCPKVDEYLAKFDAKSVSLVFSTSYAGNPGSMFGHTFLKVNSKKRPEVLDFGINYAAQVPPDENGLAFVFFGITGGYLGQYSMLPYYNKVNEYVNSESRDLWEYELNVNTEETNRMLRHLWEIETNSWVYYYFFDENCSYQLLTALEVAKPEWDISDFGIYTIPAETIKRLTAIPGAVKEVKFRPSLRKKMMQKTAAFRSTQKDEFLALIRDDADPARTTSSLVLDTAADYFQFEKQKNDGKLGEAMNRQLTRVLSRRSEIQADSGVVLPPIPEDTRPDVGHYPYRLGISGGVYTGKRYFQEFNLKLAYHDLLNDDLGYMKFSHIDFPGFTLRHMPNRPGKPFQIERINALAITSLFPVNFVEQSLSWRFNLDYYTPRDFGCDDCHALRGEGGIGGAVELFTRDAIAYVLAVGYLEAGSTFRKGWRFGPKLEAAVLANPFRRYKIRLAAAAVGDLAQPDRQKAFYQLDVEQSLSISRSLDFRATVTGILPTTTPTPVGAGKLSYTEGKATLNYYF